MAEQDLYVLKVPTDAAAVTSYSANENLFLSFLGEDAIQTRRQGSILQVTIAISGASGSTILSPVIAPAGTSSGTVLLLNNGNTIENETIQIFEWASTTGRPWDIQLDHACDIEHLVVKEILK